MEKTNAVLSERQINILWIIGEEASLTARYYLTGGTALAGFYLFHRYSEDLDFFSEEEHDAQHISLFLSGQKKHLGFDTIDFQQSMNRNLFFIHFPDEILKMEFTYFPFPRIEVGNKQYGIQIDSLIDVAVNKLFSIYQRCVARDYIDLFLICKEGRYAFDELIAKARIKFDWHIDPLQLGTQFLKARDAKDLPRMIKDISRTEWEEFFVSEALKLKKDILI